MRISRPFKCRPNPSLSEGGVRALAMVFNPTDFGVRREPLELPLYYSGLTRRARVEVVDGATQKTVSKAVMDLDREYNVVLVIGGEMRLQILTKNVPDYFF